MWKILADTHTKVSGHTLVKRLASRTVVFLWFASTLCAGFFLPSCFTPAAESTHSRLKSIQQDIVEKEKKLNLLKQHHRQLVEQLQSQETFIAEASHKLRKTQRLLSSLNTQVIALNTSVKQLLIQQQQQEKLLAQQLDAAFRQGQQGGLQRVFEGNVTQRSERIMAWFSYLNHAREKNINELKQTRQELMSKKTSLVEKQTQQRALLDEERKQQNKLEQARDSRQKTIDALASSLKKNQLQLTEMHQNQARLQQKIASAEREARARAEREEKEADHVRSRQQQAKSKGTLYQPTAGERALMSRIGGLGRPAGQALWPVRGTIGHRFGEMMQGELRWKGLVISAPEGSEVKAIADGRVLMADWLQGYGLVVVIEHGKGDMSLYGYNQSALVTPGSQVKAGQPVALVGNSGGQGIPSLYFEIRRQGHTVNPLPWLGK